MAKTALRPALFESNIALNIKFAMNSNIQNTEISRKVWDDFYVSQESGPVGQQYPNEPLVRIVSTLRKGVNFDSQKYFGDQGKENSNRTNFVGDALEIGFGHVSNLMMMNDKGFNCVGLEVSQEAVERGRARLHANNRENIELQHWIDLRSLPFDSNSFDFIFGLQCIYYNVDLVNIISEIHRCLKPGGYFAFSFFSTNHDYHKYIDILEVGELCNIVKWSDIHPNPRIRGSILCQPRSKESLISLFSDFGEKRIFTEETDFAPTFNSWWYIYGKNNK